MSNTLQKSEIRKTHLKKRLNQDNQILSYFSNEILKRLEVLEDFQKAKVIMFYIPIKNEVNTIPLIEKYIKKKGIALPKSGENSHLEIFSIKSLDDLIEGKYKIPEPKKENSERIETKSIDLIIVPGISFDRKGYRLGYGKGYYDKLLKKTDCKKIALAYDFQIHKNIPVENHDERVDLIITEKEIIKIH